MRMDDHCRECECPLEHGGNLLRYWKESCRLRGHILQFLKRNIVYTSFCHSVELDFNSFQLKTTLLLAQTPEGANPSVFVVHLASKHRNWTQLQNKSNKREWPTLPTSVPFTARVVFPSAHRSCAHSQLTRSTEYWLWTIDCSRNATDISHSSHIQTMVVRRLWTRCWFRHTLFHLCHSLLLNR